LEVIGHDGIARNITMVPGDLVLYESHSIIHSRPFPLKGRFMANIFIHFEPIGPIGGQVLYDGDLPPYVIPGSPEEEHWRADNPHGHKVIGNLAFETGSTRAHQYASQGALEELQRHLDRHQNHVNIRDRNGWTPLHEAVRNGDIRLIELLLNHGADVNARTGAHAEGGSPLWWAEQIHDAEHPVAQILREREAKKFEPEL
jgi:prolyl 4-hydroxylase